MVDEAGSHDADVAAALASAPRGLAVLARLCGEDLDLWTADGPPPGGGRPSLGAGLRIARVDPERGGLVTEDRAAQVLADPDELAAEVLGAIDGAAWWGDRPRLSGSTRHADVFRAAAAGLLAAPGARWWADALVRDEQVVLGPADAPPDLTALAAEQERLVAGPPWRVPQVLTTSRRGGQRLPAVRLASSEAAYRWGDPVGVWRVSVDPGARVYEIGDLDDWRRLCRRYPFRGPTPGDYRRWGVTTDLAVAPDWQAVQEDWDGVHVTMLALMTVVGRPVDVDDGVEGVLEDVDTEMTAWLRPSIGHLEFVTAMAATSQH